MANHPENGHHDFDTRPSSFRGLQVQVQRLTWKLRNICSLGEFKSGLIWVYLKVDVNMGILGGHHLGEVHVQQPATCEWFPIQKTMRDGRISASESSTPSKADHRLLKI